MSKTKKLGRQGKTIFRKDGKVHRGIEDEVDWSRKRIEDVQRRIEEDEMIREKYRQKKEEDAEHDKVGEKKMMEMIRVEKNREFRMRREMMRAEQMQTQSKDTKTLSDGIFSVGQSAIVLSDHLSNQSKAHSQSSIAKRRVEEELKIKEDDPDHSKKEEIKTVEMLRAEKNREFRLRREQTRLEKPQAKNISSGLFVVGNSAIVLSDSLSNQTKSGKVNNNSPNLDILNAKRLTGRVEKEEKHEWEGIGKGKEEKGGKEKGKDVKGRMEKGKDAKGEMVKGKKEMQSDAEESRGMRDWLEEIAICYFKLCCCV